MASEPKRTEIEKCIEFVYGYSDIADIADKASKELAALLQCRDACLSMFPDGEEYCGTAADLVSDAADALRKAGLDEK